MGGKTISDEVKFKDTIRKKVIAFKYTETKSSDAGGGPRGIEVYLKGTQNKKAYAISPNPHDNRAYNKGQSDFYKALGTALATHYLENDDAFPSNHKVTWKSTSYTLK
jgi:hypothetical protein